MVQFKNENEAAGKPNEANCRPPYQHPWVSSPILHLHSATLGSESGAPSSTSNRGRTSTERKSDVTGTINSGVYKIH